VKYIDLRSDTVTLPTKEMYEAMMAAPLGDDVAGDDPTVTGLETLCAGIMGKESALFVPSGTMGNLCSILSHTSRGDEALLCSNSHIVAYEVGGIAALGGVMSRNLTFPGGIPDAGIIEAAIRPDNIHHPPTRLICLENALGNGRVVPPDIMADIYEIARRRGIPVHLDGARIFNAAASLNIDVKELVRYCDSVSFCLSKGLCAPVGAVVAGSGEFILRAKKYRKMLGGGMRQSGILAAAGMVAVTKMPGRLGEDHNNAKYLAEKLSALDYVRVDIPSVEINIVFADIDKPAAWKENLPAQMLKSGVKIYDHMNGRFRFLTHNGISRDDIDEFIEKLSGAI
jgi:threonine aldolase